VNSGVIIETVGIITRIFVENRNVLKRQQIIDVERNRSSFKQITKGISQRSGLIYSIYTF